MCDSLRPRLLKFVEIGARRTVGRQERKPTNWRTLDTHVQVYHTVTFKFYFNYRAMHLSGGINPFYHDFIRRY